MDINLELINKNPVVLRAIKYFLLRVWRLRGKRLNKLERRAKHLQDSYKRMDSKRLKMNVKADKLFLTNLTLETMVLHIRKAVVYEDGSITKPLPKLLEIKADKKFSRAEVYQKLELFTDERKLMLNFNEVLQDRKSDQLELYSKSYKKFRESQRLKRLSETRIDALHAIKNKFEEDRTERNLAINRKFDTGMELDNYIGDLAYVVGRKRDCLRYSKMNIEFKNVMNDIMHNVSLKEAELKALKEETMILKKDNEIRYKYLKESLRRNRLFSIIHSIVNGLVCAICDYSMHHTNF